MPTNRTGLAGVGRIDQHRGDAGWLGFGAHHLAQLAKGPAVQPGALAAPDPDPRAQAPQVFQGQRPLRALRLDHELLADTMVGVAGKALLLARQFLQFAFGRSAAHLLQFAPLAAKGMDDAALTMADVIDMAVGSCRVHFAVRVQRHIADAQIHPQSTLNFLGRRFCHLAGGMQVEAAFSKHQITFSLLSFQQLGLTLTTLKGDPLPACQGPDRNLPGLQRPAQDTAVVGDGANRFEAPLPPAVQLVAGDHLGDAAHSQLSGEAELFSDRIVDQTVQRYLAEGLILPGDLADPVAGGVGRLQGIEQADGLLGRGKKFDLGAEFHPPKYSTDVLVCGLRHPSFLPRLKPEVS